jgi:transposase-like protein
VPSKGKQDSTGATDLSISRLDPLFILKLLYTVHGHIECHTEMTMPIQNWSQALSQLDIYFKGRLEGELKI